MSNSSILLTAREEMLKKRRKEVFGDCALIEIIHLHDCLRGAIRTLENDVNDLEGMFQDSKGHSTKAVEMERRIAGRFRVIWSVFKSHSKAEDQFIWPALKDKTQGKITGSPNYVPGIEESDTASSTTEASVVEQADYEEDHADEERMFFEMDGLLTKFRSVLVRESRSLPLPAEDPSPDFLALLQQLVKSTRNLSEHLMIHLEKEEMQCLPLVAKHLTKQEIHSLVGSIMGQRSANIVVEIMTMAVQSLDETERQEMVKYMKESMEGTFFDRWLTMSGWNPMATAEAVDTTEPSESSLCDRKRPAMSLPAASLAGKRSKSASSLEHVSSTGNLPFAAASSVAATASPVVEFSETSQGELERLIRAIATNKSLTSEQRTTTIQGLRDSVWKSNQKQRKSLASAESAASLDTSQAPVSQIETSGGGLCPPFQYFRRVSSDDKAEREEDPECIPLFSSSELEATFHDGPEGRVLGCPHYTRGCKVRHPKSGRLYTCRLCCAHGQEEKDEPLNRYDVTEVLCMTCNTLQPAADRCINTDCAANETPFAKYYCDICHLYDGDSRPIFHCPYCNACRLGKGLGIDYRHCMRCNACVSLNDDNHQCIPQKLQGCCPICHDSLFESTEALRGLKCGHVMHLSCYNEYCRGHHYTCPLCMRSMEDMTDYFALLDTAVRMQPMPPGYESRTSIIYCQDCGKTGQTTYHFVGQKCPECNSYNTRELSRS